MAKRRYPFKEESLQEEEDMDAKMIKAGLLVINTEEDARASYKTPDWVIEFTNRLPRTSLKRARHESVMSIIRVLEKSAIPDASRLHVASQGSH